MKRRLVPHDGDMGSKAANPSDARSVECRRAASDSRAICWRAPMRELLALAWRDGAFPFPADVKRHQQMEAVIAVTGERQWRKTRLFDLDPEFFMQLTDQRGLRPLAGLELAAGKFPQTSKRLALGALRDQDTVVRIDQRAGDDEGELDHER